MKSQILSCFHVRIRTISSYKFRASFNASQNSKKTASTASILMAVQCSTSDKDKSYNLQKYIFPTPISIHPPKKPDVRCLNFTLLLFSKRLNVNSCFPFTELIWHALFMCYIQILLHALLDLQESVGDAECSRTDHPCQTDVVPAAFR